MRTVRGRAGLEPVLVVVLAAVAQLEVWRPAWVPGVGEVVGDRPVLATTALAATLPLALRRRAPLIVLVTVLGALAVQQVLTEPTGGLTALVAGLVAAYASSAYASPTAAAAAGAVTVGSVAVIGADAGDWAFLTVVLGGAWLLGFVVAQRSVELANARLRNDDLTARLAHAAAQLAAAGRTGDRGLDAARLADLTPREVDVVRAIARGLSNSEIAAELFISEWTVKSHVGSILRKLALRDRAQVVVAAYESHLVTPAATPEDQRLH